MNKVHGTLHWKLCIVGLLLATGCDNKQAPPPPPKPSVIVVEASVESITPNSEFVGRTQANEDTTINARVSGLLLRRVFQEGADVAKGDLLFEIDPDTYATEVAQAEARLQQAVAAKKVAFSNYNRGTEIFAAGVISAKEMDELTGYKLDTEAEVSRAKAALKAAKLNLSYTKIVAPISGRMSRSKVSEGDLISPERSLATLVNLDPIEVNFQASEKVIAKYRNDGGDNGESAIKASDLVIEMRLPNGEMYEQTGQIDFVDNRVDPTTGTVTVRALFANPSKALLPGMFVTAIVNVPEQVEALLIPQVAIQEDQLGRFVLVVNSDNKVEKRQVEMSGRYGVKWRVESGLKAGEKIIIEGLQKVRPGLEVETQMAEATPFENQG
ncbi:efflux RND transporter periplasmic adaptor subunit [Corallincola spongiicola]|uniref:Efflux RND transporter periplasmic adaptor subunit n=1 Tax=Corallincola spongiicola TaxID=2520508 RepID=A0ABY1WP14_9GAMM|nr:efflux RND transporter periplasmic adaptor subunit [Corallincola spongiicola]TAA45810.1 efflux RND transporter periplasmic adaptor subunit [Corallincola spongiicola]